jgi:hypothetical protein
MIRPDKISLIGQWIHSHEEDKEGEQIYRRKGYNFPRARGRAGFELCDDHVWVDHPIAAADGNDRLEGHWDITSSGELELRQSHKDSPGRVLQVVSVEPDRIVVKEKSLR